MLALGASTAYIVVAVLPRAHGGAEAVANAAAQFALTTPGVLGAAFIDAAVLLGVTLVSARVLRPRAAPAQRLRLGPSRISAVGTLAACVGMTGLSLACGSGVELVGIHDDGVMPSIAAALLGGGPLRIALAILAVAVAPAIAEEAFFRGLFLGHLRLRLGRWPAIVLSALAFGVFHVDPVQGTLALLAGIFLGWLVERGGSIRTSMVVHAANNAVFVVVASFASSSDANGRRAAAVAVAAGTAVFAGAVFVVRASTRAS